MCSYLYRIPQGDISLDELRSAMLSDLSEKELNSAVEVYRHAYGDTISEAEAFEEMCCDALGRMNIFEGTDLNSESYGKAQDTVRKHTAETANKGRAPPKNSTMFSREVNGKKIAWIENNPLSLKDLTNYKKVAAYIADHIGEAYTILESGYRVYIGENLPKEYTQSEYTKALLRNNQPILRAKKKAIGSFGEMIEIATNRRWEKTKHAANKDAKYGVYRYSTAFAFPVKQNGKITSVKSFDAELVILNSSDGKKYLYDIVNIKENTADETDLMERDQRRQKAATRRGASENSIRSSSENVNKKFSLEPVSDSAYMEAVERGDIEKAQRMVDEAAKKAGYTVKMYHGSKRGGGFTVFRDWSYFTKSKKYAQRYTERGNDKSLYSAYVKIENAFDTRKAADRYLFDEIRQEYGMGEIQDTGLPDWTDGYDIADYIDENGLNYDAIILDEGGDLVDGKPISRGLSYVIRNSNNIKSAEPITYDNNGNVIPLSERFKDNNPDIRYSREPERLNELRRQNERKLAQATAEDAANENERGLIKDYKRQYDKVSGIAEKLSTARQEVLTAERSGGGNTTAKKKIKKTPDNLSGVWQGKKASNPRPTVLETAALPAELFPYKIGGPSGTRTPDRPVMSRLL